MAPDSGSEGFFKAVTVPIMVAVGEKGMGWLVIFKPVEASLRNPRIDQHRGIDAGKEVGVNFLANPLVEGGPMKYAWKNFFHCSLLFFAFWGLLFHFCIGQVLKYHFSRPFKALLTVV
jgi:hypothetical protein